MTNKLRSIDSFAAPIPSFNLKGETHVATWYGGFISAIIFTVTLAFAIQKLHSIFAGSDPNINENIKAEHYDSEKGLDLSQANQHFAISVHGENNNR